MTYVPPLPETTPVPNNQTFGSTLTGIWSPSTSWSWSPSDSSDTKTSHQQEMPFGSMIASYINAAGNGNDWSSVTWEGTPSGTSEKIISYTATDPTDGVLDFYVLTN